MPEGSLPHRRPSKTGSFGDDVDELVKQFPIGEPRPSDAEHRKPEDEDCNNHDSLFEPSRR